MASNHLAGKRPTVVMHNDQATFTFYSMRGSTLSMQSVVSISKDRKGKLYAVTDEKFSSLVLHIMVNCDYWTQSGRSVDPHTQKTLQDRFWSQFPLCRKCDYETEVTDIPAIILDKFEDLVKVEIGKHSKYAAKLGVWTQTGVFTTGDTTGLHKKEAMTEQPRTASMFKYQANHPGWNGHFSLGGGLFEPGPIEEEDGTQKPGVLERTCLSSWREHGATPEQLHYHIEWAQKMYVALVKNGGEWTGFRYNVNGVEDETPVTIPEFDNDGALL
ncbi:hypothetical protein LTR41_011555 [Exophiala xenobiotica]|nr:hypothetical protein LTR41_011555 [Exophiala xenobiotica]